MASTLAQRPNHKGFPKPGELIEFRSRRGLTLQDRRILNLLIEHAGPQIALDQVHRIAMSALRGRHKGGERVRDSILRLMETTLALYEAICLRAELRVSEQAIDPAM